MRADDEVFLSSVASLAAEAPDGVIDAVLAAHFASGIALAPDIARAYVRRVIADPALRPDAYAAFVAFEHDALAPAREFPWTSSAA